MSELQKIDPYKLPLSVISNHVKWSVSPDRSVLLFHDMQRYFIRPFTAHSSPASDLLSNAEKLRESCKKLEIPIAYTAQPGSMNQQQRGLLKDFWGPGMNASPEDRQIIDSISPTSNDWVFTKWRYSAFIKTDLLKKMHESGRDQLIICGVYAHIGILSTAIEAFSYDIQPFVVSDATADFTSEEHQMALDYISRRCGTVISSSDVLNDMEKYYENQY